MKVTTYGLDLAKRVFQVHWVEPDTGELKRKALARADVADFFARLVPEDTKLYRHTAEGPDDMTSHIRAALTHTEFTIPVHNGSLALGTWQGVYLFEHRERPHRRSIILHLLME